MSKQRKNQNSVQTLSNEVSAEEQAITDEEKANNRFSFIVGIVIAMVIIILFTVFFH